MFTGTVGNRRCNVVHSRTNVGAYRADNIPCQSFASAAFKNAVSSIFGWCSQEQMLWIYATSVIALVAYTFRRFTTVFKKPSNSVNKFPTIPFGATSDPKNFPITIVINNAHPNPTRSKFWTMLRNWSVFTDFIGEAFWKRFVKSLRPQKLRSNVAVHNQTLSLVCRALGCSFSAGATCLIVALMLLLSSKANAGQISSGTFFTDGMTVHAADLNNAINNATITTTFYLTQVIGNTPQTSDYLLLYSPSLAQYYKITANNFIFNNTNIIGDLANKAVPTNTDLVLAYDSVGGTLVNVTVGSLLANAVTNAPILQESNISASALLPITQGGTNASVYPTNLFVAATSQLVSNSVAVSNPTNSDKLLIWSTGTNSTDPFQTNPFVGSVTLSNIVPFTFIITNVPSTVPIGFFCIRTNLSFNGTVPQMRVVLVTTNLGGSPFGLGDEVPVEHFIVTNSTRMAYQYGCTANNVWVNNTFVGSGDNNDLNTVQKGAALTYALTSHTNFNIKIYLTYYPIVYYPSNAFTTN